MRTTHTTWPGGGGRTRPAAGRACLVFGVGALLAAALACPAADLRNDGFEGYPTGQTFVTITNGWQATTNAVEVQTNVVATGAKAVVVTPGAELSNTVSAAGLTRLWTDQRVDPPLGAQPGEAPGAEESLRIYFSSNGYVGVYSGGGWDMCSNDVNGAAVPPLTSGWVRVSLHHDFVASNAAVMLRGQVLRAEVPFSGSAAEYKRVCYQNENDSSSAYVDAVLISTDLPGGLAAGPDTDNDGMAEAEEIHLYGNTTNYHRPVITVTTNVVGISGQAPGTVTPSVTDVFPGGDTNFVIAADPAFVVTAVATNGTPVGAFPGQGTRHASYTYANIVVDTVLQVTFTYNATRHVPADYTTVDAAVAAALSNETIFVADGVYTASAPLVLDAPVTLTGNTNTPGDVVLGAPVAGHDRDIFQVRCDNVTIEGFRLAGALNGTPGNDGWLNAAVMVGNDALDALMDADAAIEGLTNVLLRYNQYAGCSHGVYLHQATNPPARGSGLSGNATGVWANVTTDWRLTWWGDVTGPSGEGPGSGDAVSANVLYEPWWSDDAGSHLVYHVPPGDSIQDELDTAADGDFVMVAAGTYTEDLTISNSASLIGSDFTLEGDIDLTDDLVLGLTAAITADSLRVAAGQAVVFDGADMTVTGLTINAGGTLTVSNGTLVVGEVSLSGTFTLDDTWGLDLVAQPLPFVDGFESYGVGQRLDRLGPFGWDASSSGVVVQATQVEEGTQAVRMPEGATVSNSISTTVTAMWTDLRVLPPLGGAPEDAPAAGESVRLYFTTNGLVAVATNGGWDVCALDAQGDAVPPVSNLWVRVSLHHDFGLGEVAVFLDGRMLREAVPFIGSGVNGYHRLTCRNVSGGLAEPNAYMDAVSVAADLPDDLDDVNDADGDGDVGLDGDSDGMADAEEIHRFGDLATYSRARGAIFQLR